MIQFNEFLYRIQQNELAIIILKLIMVVIIFIMDDYLIKRNEVKK